MTGVATAGRRRLNGYVCAFGLLGLSQLENSIYGYLPDLLRRAHA